MNKLLVLFLVFGFLSQSAFAGTCILKTTRTPCSDAVKAEALKPYDGKETTDDAKKTATTAEKCIEAAKEACVIVRPLQLKEKKIVALFDGAPVGDDKENMCAKIEKAKSNCQPK